MHRGVYEFYKPSGPQQCPRCTWALQPRAFGFIKFVDPLVHVYNYYVLTNLDVLVRQIMDDLPNLPNFSAMIQQEWYGLQLYSKKLLVTFVSCVAMGITITPQYKNMFVEFVPSSMTYNLYTHQHAYEPGLACT